MGGMLDQSETRAKAARRFADALSRRAAELACGQELDHQQMGRNLEICAWNAVIQTAEPDFPLTWAAPCFRYRYTTKCLQLESNILNKDNPGLAIKLFRREVGLKEFARMHPYAMYPELWSPVFDRVARKQMQKIFPLGGDGALEGAVECKRCKSLKTTFTQLQTRSADEPMTCYFYCYECSHRWKSAN